MTLTAVELRGTETYPGHLHGPRVPPLTVAERQASPDRQLLVVNGDGRVRARCSCWLGTNVPILEGERPGAIGHYAAQDTESSDAVLEAACARLTAAGCTQAIGPLDGSTWQPYRLVVGSGPEPPFFLEPWTPAYVADRWRARGFTPIAEYVSAVAEDLSREDPRFQRAATRLENAGIRIRPLDVREADADLRRIHALCLESFRSNFLFSPIGVDAFLEGHRKLLEFVRPELVLLAERRQPSGKEIAGGLCGFLLALPDVLEANRQQRVDTVIVKTVAVLRAAGVAGLGSVLVARAHRLARELGFRRAVHALMHERNVSRNISRRYATPFRRYALFARPLQGPTAP
jgi:hypothetical protein